jgi:phosphoserine phosphatase
MEARYKAGTVNAQEFADFYVGTLAGATLPNGSRCARRFWPHRSCRAYPPAAHQAGEPAHLDAGDLVVLTTATNRFITELTAQYLGIAHLIATDPKLADGVFTGHTQGHAEHARGQGHAPA